MTSENERLLKNIKEEKTVNQISLDMNISNKKIFQRIKNLSVNGYSFSKLLILDCCDLILCLISILSPLTSIFPEVYPKGTISCLL